jgi:hypothetical protein
LHNVELLKGLAVSVTTDGFITDLKDLEETLKSKNDKNLAVFRKSEKSLADLNKELKAEKASPKIRKWAIKNYKNKIITLVKKMNKQMSGTIFYNIYSKQRSLLSGSGIVLEVKHAEVKGLLS